MKLEDQVCSLDLAKKLKELGVKQDSIFYWKPNFDGYRLIACQELNLRYDTSEIDPKMFMFGQKRHAELLPLDYSRENRQVKQGE